ASDDLFRIAVAPARVPDQGPAALALAPVSPNPGLGACTLLFTLPQAGSVRLEVLDLTGRRLWMTDGALPSGTHARRWDGVSAEGVRVGPGLYFARLVTPWGIRTGRFALLR